jgi:FMN phosphatase YigB (HAD superfamily)
MISNARDDRDVQALVDKAGIRNYFTIIVTSAAQGIRKPNPRIFHTVLDQMGIPPAHAAMVGDTLGADILGAQYAGVYSIWITRRAELPSNRAHQDTIQPDAAISTLVELPALLDKLE